MTAAVSMTAYVLFDTNFINRLLGSNSSHHCDSAGRERLHLIFNMYLVLVLGVFRSARPLLLVL